MGRSIWAEIVAKKSMHFAGCSREMDTLAKRFHLSWKILRTNSSPILLPQKSQTWDRLVHALSYASSIPIDISCSYFKNILKKKNWELNSNILIAHLKVREPCPLRYIAKYLSFSLLSLSPLQYQRKRIL